MIIKALLELFAVMALTVVGLSFIGIAHFSFKRYRAKQRLIRAMKKVSSLYFVNPNYEDWEKAEDAVESLCNQLNLKVKEY